MTRVQSVELTVTLDNGDTFTLNESRPAPSGDNPRFVVAEMTNGVFSLGNRMAGVLKQAVGVDQIVEEGQ